MKHRVTSAWSLPREASRGVEPHGCASRPCTAAAGTRRRGSAIERDVAAEVIYPTVGMMLCNHRDADYKHACFQAYNRWIVEYCSFDPARLLGVGQTAMRSPADGIEDLRAIKALGLRGVMMPGNPAVEDYDSPVYDDFWRPPSISSCPLVPAS
jgi:predicted TIM-barrel fold metal-dependent hydrolase